MGRTARRWGINGCPHREPVVPSSPDQPDQVRLGDPQLDVPARRALLPMQDRVGVVGEPVDGSAVGRPHADLVDPPAEIGAGADIRAHSDDAAADLRALPRLRSSKVRPRAACVVPMPLRACAQGRRGSRSGRPHRRLCRGSPPLRVGALDWLRGLSDVEPAPGIAQHRHPAALPMTGNWGKGEECRVVLWMPLAGQPIPLDGVGEDHRRARVVNGVECRAERRRSWPPRSRNTS